MKMRILVALLVLTLANVAFGQVQLTCSNPTQSPDSTVSAVNIGTVITLSVDTTGAVDAQVGGVPMTPDVDPNSNDNVTWTATHTAVQDLTIDVVASSAGNAASVSCSWSIDVVELPPGFSKAFAPAQIAAGGVSTLTFSIDNALNPPVSSLAFADPFPAGMVVASPANAASTCTGGTLTAVPGDDAVSYAGGAVDIFSSCAITVDVTVATAGNLVNTSGELTSSAGSSGPATATLSVTAAPPPPAAPIPSMGRVGLGLMTVVLLAFGLRARRPTG